MLTSSFQNLRLTATSAALTYSGDLFVAVAAPPIVAPGAPTAVVAAASGNQARVAWTAPVSDGGSPITYYMATVSPTGGSCITTSTTCLIAPVYACVPSTVTVRANNAVGVGAASAPVSVSWAGPAYHPVTPTRILDSRDPFGPWNAKLSASLSRTLAVTGLGGPSNVPPPPPR